MPTPIPISVGKKFHELRDKIDAVVFRELAKVIPRQAIVNIDSYAYGDQVFDANKDGNKFVLSKEVQERFTDETRRPLAIVLQGCVEISNEDVLGYPIRTVAYRPIRIARPTELLGDFSILDGMFAGAGPVRSGETWSGWAGVSSIYCRRKLDPDAIKQALIAIGIEAVEDQRRDAERDRLDNEIEDNRDRKLKIREALKFVGGLSDVYKTHVAYLEDAQSLMRKHLRFNLWVTGQAWVRCKQYRNSFHAFNYHRLVNYRQIAQPAIQNEKTALKGGAGDKIGSVEVLYLGIPEMLFDLINRPLRNEPVFTSIGRLAPAEQMLLLPVQRLASLASRLKSSSGVQLSVGDFLVPAILEVGSTSPAEYYYPADQQNYFLAQWLTRLHDKVIKGEVNRTYELFKKDIGADFLVKIIRLCVSTAEIQVAYPKESKRLGKDPEKLRASFQNLSEKLYKAAHKDGVDKSGDTHLTCVLESLDGQLFCSYRLNKS